jgi:3-phenylpropionate/trans-cinnamate dioxygenase ferredoxin subunit
MHKACPLSELASGDALRPDTAPPTAVFHTEAWDATPAKPPVRTHEMRIVVSNIMIIESDEALNFRPV